MKTIKIIKNIIYTLLIVLLCLFASVVVASNADTPLKIRLFSVSSGSMEPAIHTGSVVISRQAADYKKGDIITYTSSQNAKSTVTHRVFKIENLKGNKVFYTKGDANNIDDKTPIQKGQILGSVVFIIPYIGYVVEFSKTQVGFLVMVIIPATLIVYTELVNIKNEIVKMLLARKVKSEKIAENIQ